MTMKYRFLSIIVLTLSTHLLAAASAFRDIPIEEINAAFDHPIPPHPRLFLPDAKIADIRSKIHSQPDLELFYNAMLKKADGIMGKRPVTRIKTGRRLLSVSRECLDRVMHLSAAWRFSGKEVYLKRAEMEMLAAAGFTDWNPSHFLDVAEMTAALATGYDWCYSGLSEDSRRIIRQAILEKGLQPSLQYHGWARGDNNWNQVCNGGITLGVLAIMENEPKLARELVHRAVNGVQVVMKQYEPDGAYPEGPGYWVYGTSYNVIFLAALESVLGTDFGLSTAPGFSRSASYYLHVAGPTGLYFNYPDSGSAGGFEPTVLWFAHKYNQPSLAWEQMRIWKGAGRDPSELVESRFAPLALLWADGKQTPPADLSWMGRGSNPVAMFRTSWTDRDASYIAMKGGSPGVNHGHMDVGSFVFDSQGVRWAADLGPESYNKIESRGMNLWGREPNAQRWTIFRYNNLSHSTLVVNGAHQRVEGYAPIIRYSDKAPLQRVVFDMSKVYEGQLASALRGAALLPEGQAVIQDELEAGAKPATVRWAMVTPAKVSIESANTAILTKSGKTLRMTVGTDKPIQLKTWSTEPKADYDAPNGDTRLVGFEISLSAGQEARIVVTLSPSTVGKDAPANVPALLQWSAPVEPLSKE
jgi:hypothetical protein